MNPEEKEFIIEMIRELARKIRELEIQLDNLGYFIADEDEYPEKCTQ